MHLHTLALIFVLKQNRGSHYATGDLLDILPMLLKDDDLVDAEHHAGPGDLPGQVGAELCGLGVVQDRAGQGHAHRVPAT